MTHHYYKLQREVARVDEHLGDGSEVVLADVLLADVLRVARIDIHFYNILHMWDTLHVYDTIYFYYAPEGGVQILVFE